jgi:hypothetical protein
MILPEDDHVVEALASDTSEEPLADRIQIRGLRRIVENDDTCTLGDRGKLLPKLVVVIADQVSRPFAPGSGLPQLLCGPLVARRPSDIEVEDFAGPTVDDEERKEGPEHHVVELQKITSLDIAAVVVEKGRPRPPRRYARFVNPAHVLLDSPLAHFDAELEELTADALCSPGIIRRQLQEGNARSCLPAAMSR